MLEVTFQTLFSQNGLNNKNSSNTPKIFTLLFLMEGPGANKCMHVARSQIRSQSLYLPYVLCLPFPHSSLGRILNIVLPVC